MSMLHQTTLIDKYLKKPENKLCADCKRPSPSWASLNLGVFVCIKCSGCHREIGVHVTKIKSTNLDLWPTNVLVNFGKITNYYWEHNLPSDFDFEKIKNNDYRLQDFIRDKYERKRFVDTKKTDPMTLINQGYDISKDVAHKTNGSSAWEDDEEETHQRNQYVKPKPGPNFNICSKGEAKQVNQTVNTQQQIVVNNINYNNNDNYIDFDTKPIANQSNNTKSSGSGFSFIKKNNTIPKATNIIQTQPIVDNNLDSLVHINSTSSNTDVFDLFTVQSHPPKAIQDLSDNLLKAYQEPDNDPNKTQGNQQIKIKMNYPNININNYYQNPSMMPINQPYLYPQPYPMNQPYINYNQPPIGNNNNYYANKPNPITTPFVLDLYNPVKPDKIKPEQPIAFTPNSNYKDSLNHKQSNDPFKNLVSFN